MGEYFRYVWLCFKAAFTHGWDTLDRWSTIVGVVLPFLAWLFPGYWNSTKGQAAMIALAWEIPCGFALAFTGARLIASPFLLWKEQKDGRAEDVSRLTLEKVALERDLHKSEIALEDRREGLTQRAAALASEESDRIERVEQKRLEEERERRQKEENGRRLLDKCSTYIRAGKHPINALILVEANYLETEDELARLCNDLVANDHPHPFKGGESLELQACVTPEGGYLSFLRGIVSRGYTFATSVEIADFFGNQRSEHFQQMLARRQAAMRLSQAADTEEPKPEPSSPACPETNTHCSDF